MAQDILLRRVGSRLEPFDETAERDVLALKSDGPFIASIRKPRSVVHNSLYWTCIHSICASGGFDDGEEVLHAVTKLGSGCFKVVELSGVRWRVPDSTAFAKMDQAAFNAYFRRAVAFWQSEGLSRWINPDLFNKISEAA